MFVGGEGKEREQRELLKYALDESERKNVGLTVWQLCGITRKGRMLGNCPSDLKTEDLKSQTFKARTSVHDFPQAQPPHAQLVSQETKSLPLTPQLIIITRAHEAPPPRVPVHRTHRLVVLPLAAHQRPTRLRLVGGDSIVAPGHFYVGAGIEVLVWGSENARVLRELAGVPDSVEWCLATC